MRFHPFYIEFVLQIVILLRCVAELEMIEYLILTNAPKLVDYLSPIVQ